MTKAYGYIRVSGKDQIYGDGPERQELAIRRFAAEAGYEIVRVFVEQVCGETMDRPEFIAMVMELAADGVRAVIVDELARLSRFEINQEICIQRFTEAGWAILSADPDEGDLMATADLFRVLMRQFLGAVAQYDKAMTVARLRGLEAARRKAG